jgi:hypothetical protein
MAISDRNVIGSFPYDLVYVIMGETWNAQRSIDSSARGGAMKIEQLYQETISQLPTADRLRLARLILEGIPQESVVDFDDEWSDEDLRELSLASLARFEAEEEAIDTELHLSTERNHLRLEAELRANKTLIQQIAAAQAELAERLVEEWKRKELEKIENGGQHA